MILEQVYKRWDSFWFAQSSPAPICLYRLCYGFLCLCSLLLLLPDLQIWFGSPGIVTLDTMRQYSASGRFSLFYWLPQADAAVFVICVGIVAAILVTVGLRTRSALVVLWICLVSLQHRNMFIFNAGDALLRVIGFLLIFSPAGQMFSIDRAFKVRQGKVAPDQWSVFAYPWVQRLIQLQIAALYCQTFLGKLGGDSWCNGTAIYYSSRLVDAARFPIPFLFDHLWTIKLATWSVLVIEFALWTGVWFKSLRYWVLFAGILLHLLIDWTMNIPLLSWVVITTYLNFVDPADIRRVFEWTARYLVNCVQIKSNVMDPII